MSVIFSTYHSLDVISRAQHLYGLPPIDLVICDEAHRTTGATFESEDESNFVKIHDNEFIKAASLMNPPGAAAAVLGRPDGAQSSDGTEPRALPWAGMEQAVGLESAPFASPVTAAQSSAPTGHKTIGQGNALGSHEPKNPSPVGAPRLGQTGSGQLVRAGPCQRTRPLPAACQKLHPTWRVGLRVRETWPDIGADRRLQQPRFKDGSQGMRIPRSGLFGTQAAPSFRHALTTKNQKYSQRREARTL